MRKIVFRGNSGWLCQNHLSLNYLLLKKKKNAAKEKENTEALNSIRQALFPVTTIQQ